MLLTSAYVLHSLAKKNFFGYILFLHEFEYEVYIFYSKFGHSHKNYEQWSFQKKLHSIFWYKLLIDFHTI